MRLDFLPDRFAIFKAGFEAGAPSHADSAEEDYPVSEAAVMAVRGKLAAAEFYWVDLTPEEVEAAEACFTIGTECDDDVADKQYDAILVIVREARLA
jgi:hypothetical protein